MMSLEPRNEPQMLQWFRRTYPSYNLQPLLLKRQRELGGGAGLQRLARGTSASPGGAAPGRREPADGGSAPPGPSAALRARRAQGRRTRSGRSCRAVTLKEMKTLRAHGFSQRPRFEQVVGYLERNEPLPLDQPDRKATTFVTSHFYLDDFVQSSEDPNPQPLQHTPLKAIFEEGFRTPAEATDEDLARMRQGGGNRFGEDDLAGDPEADALTNNGQGPPSITGRLRSAADGAQAAADLVGAGVAGLAAAQAFRSQLPQDAAEYVRLNVERGAAQAIEETAAVAAEEGEVAVAAEGVGGAFGYLGGRCFGAHGGRGCWSEVGAAATAGLAVGLAGGAAYGLARGTGWVLENTLFRPQQGSEDAAVQDVRSANNMHDATQPQHFTLRTGSSTSGSPASSRASSQSGFRVQAQTNRRPR